MFVIYVLVIFYNSFQNDWEIFKKNKKNLLFAYSTNNLAFSGSYLQLAGNFFALIKYLPNLITKIGQGNYDELSKLSEEPRKYMRHEIIDLKKLYKAKIKELQKS